MPTELVFLELGVLAALAVICKLWLDRRTRVARRVVPVERRRRRT